MKPLIEIAGLRAGYGPINVLWGVDLAITVGRVTTIVGPNGAGKTTLLRALMGLIRPSAGTITHDHHDITGAKTWDIVERGLVMIPEGRLVFADMSVEDNLKMGAFPRPARAEWKANLARAYETFPRLAERRRQIAGSLSGGEAQMLAIARGLMEEPRVLLIDEPSLGLSPVMVDDIFRTLHRLKDDGQTMVLVEQNTNRALALADDVHLMRGGKVALSQAASDVDLARLHDLYFARETAGA